MGRRHLIGIVGGLFIGLLWILWGQTAYGENLARPVRARGSSLARYAYAQVHMGVEVRLTFYAPSKIAAERVATAAFRRIAELDDIMNDYRPTSELFRLSAKSGGPPVRVSRELFTVLERAQSLARRTGGAFDVTAGPVIALWREARKTGRLPSPEALREARARAGWEKVRLNPKDRTVQLLAPGMKLDLGGIAKGYVGDEAIRTLKRQGIARALYGAGGDLVASGPPPGQRGWLIKVANTGKGWVGRAPESLLLANAALSSSGDTEQFVEIGGRRYSHIVDPRTGVGLTDRIAVTVLAPDGITSDSLSTALSVLGPEQSRALHRPMLNVSAWFRRAERP
ncbi:MAG: FAD:protein FMN transferase [Armatimonadetes bacterium]|nr:FAD:protein FMN transferase [Armatimonadota bacterium]